MGAGRVVFPERESARGHGHADREEQCVRSGSGLYVVGVCVPSYHQVPGIRDHQQRDDDGRERHRPSLPRVVAQQQGRGLRDLDREGPIPRPPGRGRGRACCGLGGAGDAPLRFLTWLGILCGRVGRSVRFVGVDFRAGYGVLGRQAPRPARGCAGCVVLCARGLRLWYALRLRRAATVRRFRDASQWKSVVRGAVPWILFASGHQRRFATRRGLAWAVMLRFCGGCNACSFGRLCQPSLRCQYLGANGAAGPWWFRTWSRVRTARSHRRGTAPARR
mmetsp:Transcript_45485/g.137904  ORF Transcript_45485/g.137904 Transcript_45485/m.137904 type:complete len:277 (+) Transcript_45485:80-910(+)